MLFHTVGANICCKAYLKLKKRIIAIINKVTGVLRDTARAPQPPTNPPTGHQISRQGLAQNDQKCRFWAKFGCYWAKNPNSYWRKQKFWYPHNKKNT